MGEHPEYKASIDRLLDGMMKTQPHNPVVLSALGKGALAAGEFSEAQEDLNQAIAAGSASASHLDLYSRLLTHSGLYAEAAPFLERDIALNP